MYYEKEQCFLKNEYTYSLKKTVQGSQDIGNLFKQKTENNIFST